MVAPHVNRVVLKLFPTVPFAEFFALNPALTNSNLQVLEVSWLLIGRCPVRHHVHGGAD